MLDDLAILVIIPLLSLMVAFFIECLREVRLRRQSQQIYLLMTQLSLNEEEEAPPAYDTLFFLKRYAKILSVKDRKSKRHYLDYMNYFLRHRNG